MLNRWNGIEEFVAVIDRGSFSAAALYLQVSKAHVSQQVGRLEDRLGTRLLHRTTRKITLSEAGEHYLALIRPLLESLEGADAVMSGVQQNVSGRLRISSPHLIGEVIVVPALAEFQRLHPKLDVDIELTSYRVDLMDGHYDVAIQLGECKDRTNTHHFLATTNFQLVASPSYIDAFGEPHVLSDLSEHQCLMFSSRGQTKPWKFVDHKGGVIDVKVKSQWRTNSGHLLRVAARQGLGIAYLPDYYIKEDLSCGELVPLVNSVESVDRSLVAIYRRKTYTSYKIHLFVEFLKKFFIKNKGLFDV